MTKSKTISYWILGFIFSFAILLRTIAFAYRSEFEDDECRLICAFTEKSWWEMFLCIGHAQSAPPIFLFIERLWGSIWKYNEYALKLIPYLSSIASLFVFYKLTEKYFQHQYTRLTGMLLFSVNQIIITFSSIAKQYSSDVLICLLCAYFLPEIDVFKLDKKSLIKLAVVLIMLPLVSLPSLFFIGAFFIINIKKENLKRLAVLSIPFLITMLLYYFFNLAPSKVSLDEYFPSYWDEGFINLHNWLSVLVINFKYAFKPNNFTLFELFLFGFGLVLFAKDRDTYGKFTLIVFGLVLLASVLKLYPYISRVSLYSYPLLILACTKPLDTFKAKSWQFYLLVMVYLISFYGYNHNCFRDFLYKETFISYAPKALMDDLIDKYNPDTDIVLSNSASTSSFLFYAGQAGFLPKKLEELPRTSDKIIEYLDELPKGQNYWFYLVKDYIKNPVFETIMEWSFGENLIYGKQVSDSYLFVIKR